VRLLAAHPWKSATNRAGYFFSWHSTSGTVTGSERRLEGSKALTCLVLTVHTYDKGWWQDDDVEVDKFLQRRDGILYLGMAKLLGFMYLHQLTTKLI